ncbi:hypothetical protein EXIGLDRAFT_840781, partial [Exidia glandulosa HHB12029]
MAESERQQIPQFIQQNAPPNVPLDQGAIAKQLSLLSQSGSTRAKEYEVFNKMNAAQQHQQYRERVQNFFKFVAQYMNTRGLVLPPFISGLNTPPYDPNGSPFAWLEPGSHMSTVKVADRDVDLFKLWQLVWSGGTSQKARNLFIFMSELTLAQITSENAWFKVVQALDLPQQLSDPHPATASMSTADLLQKIFMTVLGSFEVFYVQKTRSQVRAQQQEVATPPQGGQDDADGDDKKRKSDEDEERDPKKMKMDPSVEPTVMPSPEAQAQSPQRASTVDGDVKPPRTIATRNKIEYVPLKRELDTFGGRDLDAIEREYRARVQARPSRGIDDWGTIDVEGLSFALRSRIASEMSYALVTLTYLSFMRSSTPNRGFPLQTSGELLDDLLDLLEETAFGPGYDGLDVGLGEKMVMPEFPKTDAEARATRTWTNRELINFVHEESSAPFGALAEDASRERPRGPLPPRSEIIRTILDIFRNLSPCEDNNAHLAQQPRFTDLLLRLTVLSPVCAPMHPSSPLSAPRPVSDALTLRDMIDVRREVIQILANMCAAHSLADDSPYAVRVFFDLVSSYLVDADEALSPSNSILSRGESTSSTTVRPPQNADTTLEVLSRIALPDSNRQIFSRCVPQERVQVLFVALVHMLPVIERDFLITFKAAWQVWVEKIVLCLYSLAFLAPPDVKRRIKADRALGFGGIMLRLIKRYVANIHPDYRDLFSPLARRAIETVKVIDDGEDMFVTPAESGGAILGFGMGYGESTIQRIEKGMGMFGGRQEDVTWQVMANAVDEVMFAELD